MHMNLNEGVFGCLLLLPHGFLYLPILCWNHPISPTQTGLFFHNFLYYWSYVYWKCTEILWRILILFCDFCMIINWTFIITFLVCSPNDTSYQCRCEDQFYWPCDKCQTYGHCDDIINNTCGCISAIPDDRQYCQPKTSNTINVYSTVTVCRFDIHLKIFVSQFSIWTFLFSKYEGRQRVLQNYDHIYQITALNSRRIPTD